MPTPFGTGLAGGGVPAADRLTPLVTDLQRRLRPLCRDWDEAEFDALVDRIARCKLRWADTFGDV